MKRLIAEHGPCPLAKLGISSFSYTGDIHNKPAAFLKSCRYHRKPYYRNCFGTIQSDRIIVDFDRVVTCCQSFTVKGRYINELAQRVTDGRLSFPGLESTQDDDVIAALVELPGIGRWTAEMFLMFGLKRLDVLSSW